MIEQLAKEMNVSTADLMSLVNSVCNSMKQDKIVDAFLNEMSEELQNDCCIAYAQHAVKKFQSFQTAYMTNPQLKKDFDTYTYELLKHQTQQVPAV